VSEDFLRVSEQWIGYVSGFAMLAWVIVKLVRNRLHW